MSRPRSRARAHAVHQLCEQLNVDVEPLEQTIQEGGARSRAVFESGLKQKLELDSLNASPSAQQIEAWVDWADALEEDRLRVLLPHQLDIADELGYYRAITALHEYRVGAHLRWIDVDASEFSGSGFLCEVVMGKETPVLTLRNMHGVYYSLKLERDQHTVFQKLTHKEIRILQFLDALRASML